MILLHYSQSGMRRTADLTDLFAGQTALLVGGAPTLKQQPLDLLTRRGVLTMAMNNAGIHFQPALWCGVDRPECYEPQLLMDPRIMKFGNISHASQQLDARYDNKTYAQMPNTYFYMLEEGVAWDELLSDRRAIPWYSNTLFTAICLLYHLGIRRIILAGSDFAVGTGGAMYAHGATLTSLETKWNVDLYNSQVHELRKLKPIFDKAGLKLLDCSVNSRIDQVYPHISMEDAVALCLDRFPGKPVDPSTLPHCSKFATVSIQERIARWPGYQVIGIAPAQPEHRATDEPRTVVV